MSSLKGTRKCPSFAPQYDLVAVIHDSEPLLGVDSQINLIMLAGKKKKVGVLPIGKSINRRQRRRSLLRHRRGGVSSHAKPLQTPLL